MQSDGSPAVGLAWATTAHPLDGSRGHDHEMLVLQPPRCSVYPELAADYYCEDCQCFVSSHGHVRGAHRNHQFLTIREAAELHVPAMRSWMLRCEEQLQQAEGLLSDLGRASRSLDTAFAEQERRIEATYATIVEALTLRKETLKRQLKERIAAEQASATQAWHRIDDLVTYYGAYLEHCSALLVNVPPVEAMDTATVLWSADVMRTAELLGSAAQVDDVWLPELVVPQVGSHYTPETAAELLHLDLVAFTGSDGRELPKDYSVRPLQLFAASGEESGESSGRSPRPSHPPPGGSPHRRHHHGDLVDSRLTQTKERAAERESPRGGDHNETHWRFTAAREERAPPRPRGGQQSARDYAIRLVAPEDPEERASVVLFNGAATLTRRRREGEEGEAEHLLVCGSPSFSSAGLYGWLVHIDRLGGDDSERDEEGSEASRVLAGITEANTANGVGVVWDGLRIIGPTEGQVYAVGNSLWKPKAGATLGFVLEIEEEEGEGEHAVKGEGDGQRGGTTFSAMLHCFFDQTYVTTVFLPSTPSSARAMGRPSRRSWCPAVSVLSPEDQVTVKALPIARALALAMLATPAA